MIAVEMGDEDARHSRRSDVSKDKLPLSPFSGVKEEPFVIPSNQVGTMIAKAGGLLTGAAEDDEVSHGHLFHCKEFKSSEEGTDKRPYDVGGISDPEEEAAIARDLEEEGDDL